MNLVTNFDPLHREPIYNIGTMQPTPIFSNAKGFIRQVRALAADSAKVFIPPLDVCSSGKIYMSQVWTALERGDLQHGPVIEEDGSVSGVLTCLTGGLPIFVTVCLSPGGDFLNIRFVEEG
ncbi:hypothetical protein [Microbulbifer discodermiae]|uniref:hypothetical protein n=1 Tax=Microbulbifer sp. 2201CG32-9 TaxID=3232309 RepID=UPI00345C04FA